jgi:hypothetical protein
MRTEAVMDKKLGRDFFFFAFQPQATLGRIAWGFF